MFLNFRISGLSTFKASMSIPCRPKTFDFIRKNSYHALKVSTCKAIPLQFCNYSKHIPKQSLPAYIFFNSFTPDFFIPRSRFSIPHFSPAFHRHINQSQICILQAPLSKSSERPPTKLHFIFIHLLPINRLKLRRELVYIRMRSGG